jgi:hypothetical protein
MTDDSHAQLNVAMEPPQAPTSGAARRALAEASIRRAAEIATPPREVNGRGNPEPTRYNDWEVRGIASDF